MRVTNLFSCIFHVWLRIVPRGRPLLQNHAPRVTKANPRAFHARATFSHTDGALLQKCAPRSVQHQSFGFVTAGAAFCNSQNGKDAGAIESTPTDTAQHYKHIKNHHIKTETPFFLNSCHGVGVGL